MTPPPSLAKGAAIAIAMRWTDRLIGLASTLILARLLVPEDFGIVAMASLLVALVDVLLDLGVHVALIQNQAADRDDYNTAWTIRIAQATVVAALVVIAAPYAADYFGDARVEPVAYVMALGLAIAGWENIGTVDFQKHFAFGKDFRFVFFKRVLGFVATIGFALVLGSYWAMVLGALVGRTAGVVLSYAMHPFRPRFSLSRAREIFAVSQWILVKSLATWLSDNLHQLVVGRISNTATMGAYAMADNISSMPTNELLAPINRVMLPAFSRAKDDPAELSRLFRLTQATQATLGLPAGVGLALVAPQAVPLLLGDNWDLAIPFVQLLAVANAMMAMHGSGNYLLMSVGRFSWSAMLQWVQVAAFLVGLLALLQQPDATGTAILRVATVMFATLVTLWLAICAVSSLRWADIAGALWRPVLATMAMALAVGLLDDGIAISPFLLLLAKVAIGAAVYGAGIGLLWLAAGRPDGAERWLVDKLGAYLLARRSKA